MKLEEHPTVRRLSLRSKEKPPSEAILDGDSQAARQRTGIVVHVAKPLWRGRLPAFKEERKSNERLHKLKYYE